jgi:deoxyribodipyrimidine photolyase
MEKLNCDALCQNRSYGEASMQRDAVLKKLCNTNRKIYKDFSDYLLVEPHDVAQRKVFTPFYKLRMELPKRTNLLQIHQIPTPQQTTQLISEHIVPSIVSPTNDS